MSLFTGAIATAIGLGASTAGSLAAAHMQSNASDKATDAQAKAAQDALDFTKQKQAAQEAAFKPYQDVSNTALQNLPGLAAKGPVQGPPMPYTTQPRATAPAMGQQPTSLSGMSQPLLRPSQSAVPASAPVSMSQFGATSGQAIGNDQLVMMQAPDGSQKAVPPNQVQYWMSKGATQV